MIWNIPTLLTWCRIFAIPLIIGVYFLPDTWISHAWQNIIATTLFILSALTDWLDGFLARRWNQASRFGAFFDPVADKLVVCSAMVLLVHLNRVHALFALVIIGREITISALREWMAAIGKLKRVRVRSFGKIKTVVQITAIGFLLYAQPFMGISTLMVGTWLMVIAVIITVWSAFEYFRLALKFFDQKNE